MTREKIRYLTLVGAAAMAVGALASTNALAKSQTTKPGVDKTQHGSSQSQSPSTKSPMRDCAGMERSSQAYRDCLAERPNDPTGKPGTTGNGMGGGGGSNSGPGGSTGNGGSMGGGGAGGSGGGSGAGGAGGGGR